MGCQQHDAQEFLRCLLEGLHEDVTHGTSQADPGSITIDDSFNPSQGPLNVGKLCGLLQSSKVADLFVGQLKSTLRCTACGHESVTLDPFWDLSLPLPSKTSQVHLGDCINIFMTEEVLEGDNEPTCPRCRKKRKCTKSLSLEKLPSILVLHLNRFTLQGQSCSKLNTTVDFPMTELDVSPYSASQALSKYDLYGVANHSGTLVSGHYTAYCKHPYTAGWHEYNDSRVQSVDRRSVNSSEAYLLFYEQRVPN